MSFEEFKITLLESIPQLAHTDRIRSVMTEPQTRKRMTGFLLFLPTLLMIEITWEDAANDEN